MNATITVTIPARWAQDLEVDQVLLRQALMLGLAQMRNRRPLQDVGARPLQALLSTGRVRRLATELVPNDAAGPKRQSPPALPGPPVSEILIAQRRGEL